MSLKLENQIVINDMKFNFAHLFLVSLLPFTSVLWDMSSFSFFTLFFFFLSPQTKINLFCYFLEIIT